MVADLGAGMDEVGVLDLQLPADPADLIVFADDDRLVGGRDREETAQQAESLLAGLEASGKPKPSMLIRRRTRSGRAAA